MVAILFKLQFDHPRSFLEQVIDEASYRRCVQNTLQYYNFDTHSLGNTSQANSLYYHIVYIR